MTAHPDLAALDRLKTRIQGLRSKTTDNGCTESEALLAAAKVAELLSQYDLSLTDVEIRDPPCEQREYETYRKKRIPLDACRLSDTAHPCRRRVRIADFEEDCRGPVVVRRLLSQSSMPRGSPRNRKKQIGFIAFAGGRRL